MATVPTPVTQQPIAQAPPPRPGHAQELQHAVAYLNMDVGVAGPNFGASAVPALKQFVREVTKAVSEKVGD